jgi:hypothetical protein
MVGRELISSQMNCLDKSFDNVCVASPDTTNLRFYTSTASFLTLTSCWNFRFTKHMFLKMAAELIQALMVFASSGSLREVADQSETRNVAEG